MSVSASRKRKRDEPVSSDHSMYEGNVACVRSILVNLRRTILDSDETRLQLKEIAQKNFPRRNEWLISFYLEKLASAGKTEHTIEGIDDIYWISLVHLCQGTPEDRLRSLFRKVDLISILKSRFDSRILPSAPLIQALSSLLQSFNKSRGTRRILLTSTETAYSTLTSCLRCLAAGDLSTSLTEDLVSALRGITLLSASSRLSSKPLNEVACSLGVSELVIFLECHDSNSLESLIRASIFSAPSLERVEVLTAALEKAVQDRYMDKIGLSKLCAQSFQAVNQNIIQSSKRSMVRNTILKAWLQTSRETRLSSLQQYEDSRLEQDKLIARPLSSDPQLTSIVYQCIQTALDPIRPDLTLIEALLRIDCDVIIPEHSEAVWQALNGSSAAVIDLAKTWLTVHIKLRQLEVFIKRFCLLTGVHQDVLSVQFLRLITNAFGTATERSQRIILSNVLDIQSPVSSQILLAMISDNQISSTIVTDFCDQLLDPPGADGTTTAQLRRMVLMKLSLQDAAKIQDKLRPIVQVNSHQANILNTLEIHMRSVELKLATLEQARPQAAPLIQRLLEFCSSEPADQMTTIRQLINRWLDIFCLLMSQDQKESFVGILFRASVDEYAKYVPLTEHSILENDGLHDHVQRLFRDVTEESVQNLLLKIPLSFFHKAVRRSILDSLTALKIKNSTTLALILKFAHAGLTAKCDGIARFIDFASELVAHDQASHMFYDTVIDTQHVVTCRKILRAHTKAISTETCFAVLEQDRAPILIRIECYRELRNRTDPRASPAQLLQRIVSDLIVNKYSAFDLYSLLSLIRCEASFSSKVTCLSEALSLLDKARKEDGVLQSEMQRICDQKCEIDRHRIGLAFELLSWMATEAQQIITLLDKLTFSDRTLEEPIARKCLSAIVRTIDVAEISSIVDQCRKRLTTSSSGPYLIRLLVELCEFIADGHEVSQEPTDLVWLVDNIFWVSEQMSKMPDGQSMFGDSMVFLQVLIDRNSQLLRAAHLDSIFLAVVRICQSAPHSETVLVRLHRILRSSFEHLAHLMRSRYHVVVFVFQNLLKTSHTLTLAISVVRLFGTFLSNGRNASTKPELFNKALAKHLPWLLTEYLSILTSSRGATDVHFGGEIRKTLEEGLIYEIMGLCGTHEREMIGVSVDASNRAIFKKLYDDYDKYGKWREL